MNWFNIYSPIKSSPNVVLYFSIYTFLMSGMSIVHVSDIYTLYVNLVTGATRNAQR